jgi:hypothetical protein
VANDMRVTSELLPLSTPVCSHRNVDGVLALSQFVPGHR